LRQLVKPQSIVQKNGTSQLVEELVNEAILPELWVFSISVCLDSKKLRVQSAEVVHAGTIQVYEILKKKSFRC